MNGVLKLWEFRGLTLACRILVFKSLVLLKLLYACTIKFPGKFVINQLNTSYKNFIWNNKRPKIKNSTLIADYHEGGFRDVHIENKIAALKIKGVTTLLDSNLYQELIQIWAKAGEKEPSEHVGSLMEQQNNTIQWDSLFHKHFILTVIMTIRDIIDECGVPLSWQDVR